jgi:hypothetical protein
VTPLTHSSLDEAAFNVLPSQSSACAAPHTSSIYGVRRPLYTLFDVDLAIASDRVLPPSVCRAAGHSLRTLIRIHSNSQTRKYIYLAGTTICGCTRCVSLASLAMELGRDQGDRQGGYGRSSQ